MAVAKCRAAGLSGLLFPTRRPDLVLYPIPCLQ